MTPRNIITIFLLIVSGVNHACDQATIEFYLEKGFTQEQITKLCSQSSASNTPAYQPYQKPIVIQQEGYIPGVSVEERRAINELRGGIEGRSIEVTDTRLNYIRRVCIRAGQSPDPDQRVKSCLDIAFSIARDGLQVTESGAGFLVFGQQQIELVSSDIKRKFVTDDPWAKFPPDLRFQLKRKYEAQEKGNKTEIPVRKSSSPAQVVSALRTVAAATDYRNSGGTQSEVAKVLDDSYVPPSEEDYLKSTPSYDDIQEEKKKKKKWWNPFD